MYKIEERKKSSINVLLFYKQTKNNKKKHTKTKTHIFRFFSLVSKQNATQKNQINIKNEENIN